MNTYFMLAAGLALPGAAAAEDASAKGERIARQVEVANEGFGSERSTMEMELFNARGDLSTRKMSSKTLEVKKDGDKSMIEFLWPADVKGTRMLTWSHKKGDDDQWMYLPAFKRVKRISSRNKTGSFMGSEFSYEDLGSQEPEKYKHAHVRDEDVEGSPHWVLERIPTDPKSGYSKQLLWIDQNMMNATKIEYYDRKGELLKTGHFRDFKQYSAKGKKLWRVGKIEMSNHQTKKRSVLTWSDRKLGQALKAYEFDQAELDQ